MASITQVDTQVQRVPIIPEEAVSTPELTVLKAVATGQSIPDLLTDLYTPFFKYRWDHYKDYVENVNRFDEHIPHLRMRWRRGAIDNTNQQVFVNAALQDQKGAGVTYESADEGSNQPEYHAHQYLYANYNSLLEDWEDVEDFHYVKFIGYEVFGDGTQIRLRFRRRNKNTNEITSFREVITFNPNVYYYYVLYRNANNRMRYWIYNTESRKYPLLWRKTERMDGDLYPILPVIYRFRHLDYFRSGDVPQTENSLNRIPIDYDNLVDSIHETAHQNTVQHAFLEGSINVFDDHEASQEYVFQFFKWLSGRDYINESAFEIALTLAVSADHITFENFNSFYIDSGAYSEGGLEGSTLYRAGFRYNYIKRYETAGSIGSVGTITREVVEQQPFRFNPTGPLENMGFRDVDGLIQQNLLDRDYLILRKQVANNRYETIEIHGLITANERYDFELDESGNINLTGNDARALRSGERGDGLYIPITTAVLDELNGYHQNAATQRGLNIAIYLTTRQEVKLSWYQTSTGGAIVTFVFAVITIVSAGAGEGLFAALSTAAGFGLAPFLFALLEIVFYNAAVAKVAEVILEAIGLGEFVNLLVAIVTVNFFGSMMGKPFAPAEALMQLVKPGIDASNKYLVNQLEDLQDLGDQLQYSLETQQEQLRQAQSFIEDSGVNFVDPLFIQEIQTFPPANESPTSYINRTIHMGNPGVAAFDVIENYVDMALALPGIDK